jgi:ABC-2 type transport system permease protein
MTQFKALYLTNAREFTRDRVPVFLVMLLPIALASFFGLVFGGGSDEPSAVRTIDLFMPGMLGIAMLWLGLFGTALPLMQQRVNQVLRRLSLTPVRPATMLLAQIGWRVTVGLIQAALFLLVGALAFQVGVDGNKLLFLAAVILGTLLFVSLGYVMAGLSPSEEGLMAITQIVNFPLMFLSGGLFPVESLPSYLQPLVALSPLTFVTDALKQLMAGAPALYPLWLDFAVMGGWLAVLLVLGVKFWRWE